MNIKSILIAVFCCVATVVFTACGDPDPEVKTLNFSRNFAPTEFKLEVTRSSVVDGSTIDVGFSWGNPASPTSYVIEVYEGETIPEGGTPVNTFTTTTAGTENEPYFIKAKDLAGPNSYMARIKALKDGAEDSKWTSLEKAFTIK